MTIRIDGTRFDNAQLRVSNDRKYLTLEIKNAGLSLEQMAALLEGHPEIEVISGGGVTAIYYTSDLKSLQMQTQNRWTMVTANLLAERLAPDAAERLEAAIKEQDEMIAQQSAVIAKQTEAITEMSGALEAAVTAAKNAQEALRALEEGIADA